MPENPSEWQFFHPQFTIKITALWQMSYMYFISLTPHTLRVFSTSISKFAFSPTACDVRAGHGHRGGLGARSTFSLPMVERCRKG